jgi:hypothetical protein
MKINFLKPAAYLLLLSLGVIFTVTSCEKEQEEIKLPPAESLIIDWSMFPSNTAKSITDAELSYGNYLFSWGTVVIWNTVVAANIFIPTFAYTEALKQTPVYIDNTLVWSFSFTHSARTIDARLTGARIDNETFSMEMVLSEAGGFAEFTWFEGVIRYDHTAANWTLSHSPDNRVEYLDIEYKKDFDTDVSKITYTVIDPQNDLYNGSINFEVDPERDLDAHYTVSKADSATYIEWSSSNIMGRVKAQHHFGDEDWHCWDALRQDVECPVEK